MTQVTEKLLATAECCAESVTGAQDKARTALADARDTIAHAAAVGSPDPVRDV